MARLEVYERSTAPLVDFYKKNRLLRVIDGTGEPQVVFQRVINALETL